MTFVLGGARSGKSSFAERLARETGLERHYVATGQAFDEEMRHRILRHQEDRGPGWMTHEAPVELVACLERAESEDRVVLVDCLTLWLSNLMMENADIAQAADHLVRHLENSPGRVILVSNEVGLGIVPDNKMGREFRDHAGRLHQQVAAVADEVYLVAAGIPLRLKG